LVEEASAASQSLSEQSQLMIDLLAHYQLGEATAVAATGAARERRSGERPWSKAPAPLKASR
jgi:hypothetical protein